MSPALGGAVMSSSVFCTRCIGFVGRSRGKGITRAHPATPDRAVALRVEPLDFVHRLAPAGGHPLRKHGQAGCAGSDTTAARSRARGSRALASFTLRVNDERAWAF
jgi:hypothetical protein